MEIKRETQKKQPLGFVPQGLDYSSCPCLSNDDMTISYEQGFGSSQPWHAQ